MSTWRRNWWTVATARSAHAGFVVIAVIIGAGWWDCMPRNLSLSITARANRGVTYYERGEDGLHKCRRRSMMIYRWSFRLGAGAFGTGKVSEWRRPRGGDDFGAVKAME